MPPGLSVQLVRWVRQAQSELLVQQGLSELLVLLGQPVLLVRPDK